MAKHPKWRRFEALAAEIQRELAPGATVTRNERIRGKRSGRLREIDIAVRQSVGQYQLLIVIDCKDYKRSVNVTHVEGFIGLLEDVGASQGAIVAARGFTTAAMTRARDAGISLYTLIDAEAHDWQSFVSIPTLADFRELASFSLEFRSDRPTPLLIAPGDPNRMVLYREGGEPINNVFNLIREHWLGGAIPMEPGLYTKVLLAEGETFIKTDGRLYYCELRADVVVESNIYFGQLAVEEIRGFADVIRGGILTNEFRTAPISVAEIERKWHPISAAAEAPFEPKMKMIAQVSLDPIDIHDDDGGESDGAQ